MGIRKIDYELCTACGICVDECPMDVIRMDEETGKPFIKYLRDCQACFLCEIDCPTEAIFVSPDRERRVPLPW
jgi:NAD-dependent dihydropyrimidine dehydrogenase PreA subunit